MSDRINCGVYVFTPDIFTAIQGVSSQRKDRGQSSETQLIKCYGHNLDISLVHISVQHS